MRIPWIQALNERRRQRREERKEQRQIERLTNAYANFDKQFAQAFGLPFNLAVRAAIAPFMEVLVRNALPDILNALAEGNPGVDGGEYDGTLVASLDGQHGAFWGEAPAGETVNYGFKVWIEVDEHENTHVKVNAGTAQFWGGEVKAYAEADVGAAAGGKYVYAVLNLSSGWASALSYGNMTGQNADTEVWVPIALVSGSSNDGFTVTQLHWGNIVIPAVTNAVDVQAK